ncbi:hypothetical protein PEDI_48880 [Persicobacter diffluens]|uniref:Uncharacterized protein n=1 Tax=Persicobacter diffluens TaxID=981 RepID=A0AAN4W444_9BACT|nr:hypothetical protein PEDI_48880 [Persicobacter diffluens]
MLNSKLSNYLLTTGYHQYGLFTTILRRRFYKTLKPHFTNYS